MEYFRNNGIFFLNQSLEKCQYKSTSTQKKEYIEPLIHTQIYSIKEQLLVDLNWLNKSV